MYYKCMFSSSSKINSLDEENKKLLQTSKSLSRRWWWGSNFQRNGVVCSDVSINNTITGDQVPAEFEFNLDITFPKILLASSGLKKTKYVLCLGIFVAVVTLNTGEGRGRRGESEQWKCRIRQELFCRVIWIMWN